MNRERLYQRTILLLIASLCYVSVGYVVKGKQIASRDDRLRMEQDLAAYRKQAASDAITMDRQERQIETLRAEITTEKNAANQRLREWEETCPEQLNALRNAIIETEGDATSLYANRRGMGRIQPPVIDAAEKSINSSNALFLTLSPARPENDPYCAEKLGRSWNFFLETLARKEESTT